MHLPPQVVTPLPTLDDTYSGPVAKALFDFEDKTEQDLLNFKQVSDVSEMDKVEQLDTQNYSLKTELFKN